MKMDKVILNNIDKHVLLQLQEAVRGEPGVVHCSFARSGDTGNRCLCVQFDTLERSLNSDIPDRFAGYELRRSYL